MNNPIQIRPGTQDLYVVRCIVEQNEYRLPDQFGDDDLIIDIGANIGAFSYACLERGCRKVVCFEPEPGNLQMLHRNLNPWPARYHAFLNPVWSDERDMFVNGPGEQWTACCHVLADVGWPVRSISIHEVLKRSDRIKLIKIDAEGAERPILDAVTAEQVAHVESIIGEVHYNLIPPDSPAPTSVWLRDTMRRLGFRTVEMCAAIEGNETIALFFARR